VRDGIFKAVKRIGGAYQSTEVGGSDKFKGKIERTSTFAVGKRFGSVGVRTAHGDLSLPQSGEINVNMTGHAHHRDATLRAHNGERFGDAAFAADAIDDVIGATGKTNDVTVTDCERASDASNWPGDVIGSDDVIGTELASEFLLMRMFRYRNDRALATVSAKCGDGEESKSARTKNNDGVTLRNIGSECAVNRACGGFDHDCGLV
jgi:hypothetical protein